MQVPRHSIFRDKALKHYAQGRKRDILPHFSSIPVALFFWSFVALLIATGLFAVYAQVPVYLTGAGTILNAVNSQAHTGNQAIALAFFQPGEATKLRAGQQVEMQIGSDGPHLVSAITAVTSGPTSLATALAHYGIKSSPSSLGNGSATVVFVSLGTDVPAGLYTGSELAMEVSVGTQSLFSSLTGIGSSTGE